MVRSPAEELQDIVEKDAAAQTIAINPLALDMRKQAEAVVGHLVAGTDQPTVRRTSELVKIRAVQRRRGHIEEQSGGRRRQKQ